MSNLEKYIEEFGNMSDKELENAGNVNWPDEKSCLWVEETYRRKGVNFTDKDNERFDHLLDELKHNQKVLLSHDVVNVEKIIYQKDGIIAYEISEWKSRNSYRICDKFDRVIDTYQTSYFDIPITIKEIIENVDFYAQWEKEYGCSYFEHRGNWNIQSKRKELVDNI